MLKNYFKIAVRSLLRNKLYSTLNIVGLAVGLACCILIALFVQNELSFDHFHANSSRLYRVTREITEGSTTTARANTPPALASALQQEFADVRATTRFMAPYPSSALVKYGERKFYEKGFLWADANVFSVFSFPLLQGNPANALAEPFTVTISESLAQKYFGTENPIGKTLTIQAWTKEEYKVTGVFRDVPANSHLQFDCLASFATAEKRYTRMFGNPEAMWGNSLVYTYVLLQSPNALPNLASQLPEFSKQHLGGLNAKYTMEVQFRLQPLTDIHLNADVIPLFEVNGDKKTVSIFSGVAVFILLLACVNFINLSTARATRRAKEIGVRKVIGAERGQLVRQFLSESLLTSLIASIVALFFAELALPAFNALSGKTLALTPSHTVLGAAEAAIFLAVVLFVGIGAGAYPALYLSNFSAVQVFKGGSASGRGKTALRKILVVTQFALAIALVIGTLTMREQLDFMRSQSLGFSKEHVVILPVRDDALFKKINAFKTLLLQHSGVIAVSAASGVPAQNMLSDKWAVTPEGRDEHKREMFTVMCDADYARAMGLQLVAGRWFSPSFPNDASEAFIINETAVQSLGFGTPEASIGKGIVTMQNAGKKGVVVGVVKDVHFASLQSKVEPTLFHIEPGMFACFAVRLRPNSVPEALSAVKVAWQAIAPEQPFDYAFLDETYERQYAADERLGTIVGVFTWLAVLVACLGLFGLASFAAEIRTKEIAVRKVLGATTTSISGLLGKEFFVLVGVSYLFACPLGYVVMNKWLQDFAYRITIGVDVLLMAGVTAFGAALVAILWQTFCAARANPVQALKRE